MSRNSNVKFFNFYDRLTVWLHQWRIWSYKKWWGMHGYIRISCCQIRYCKKWAQNLVWPFNHKPNKVIFKLISPQFWQRNILLVLVWIVFAPPHFIFWSFVAANTHFKKMLLKKFTYMWLPLLSVHWREKDYLLAKLSRKANWSAFLMEYDGVKKVEGQRQFKLVVRIGRIIGLH